MLAGKISGTRNNSGFYKIPTLDTPQHYKLYLIRRWQLLSYENIMKLLEPADLYLLEIGTPTVRVRTLYYIYISDLLEGLRIIIRT
jgi:hypothetical protein